jgi:hypothetical protein
MSLTEYLILSQKVYKKHFPNFLNAMDSPSIIQAMITTRSGKGFLGSRGAHRQLLDAMVQRRLYRNISVFNSQPTPRVASLWQEPYFTTGGVQISNCHVYRDFASPDLMIRTQGPSYLLVVELKISPSPGAIQDLDYQLRVDRDYILEHGEELAEFLEHHGLSPDEIGRLEIRFSGLVGVNSRRVKEVQHFGLFDN